MSFLYKQKLNLLDLANWQMPAKKIMVAGLDEYLKELYIRHLREQEFDAVHCPSLDAVHQHIVIYQPQLLLYHISEGGSAKTVVSQLILLRKAHPQLKIVTVGNITDLEKLRQIMDTGVSSHIDRHFSRPKDLVEVIKMLLNS